MKKRLFIAINLERPIQQEIERVIQLFKKQNSQANIKWVETENLHLTLHFLGWQEDNQLAPIKNAINEAVAGLKVINYQLAKIGCFPDMRRPRVIFVNLNSPDLSQLTHFQVVLGQKLTELGLELDKRPWQAHITLGRVKEDNRARLDLSGQIEAIAGQIRAIDLMESQLLRTGPVYQVIFSNPLE
jgi:2'-5' RNA ligase